MAKIIGASRGIGLETVETTLQAGHSVRALARSARRIPVDHAKLEKLAGDALHVPTVKRALAGVDVRSSTRLPKPDVSSAERPGQNQRREFLPIDLLTHLSPL